MESLAFFREAADHPAAAEALNRRTNGGRILGTQCSGIPEEVIHAAGILPIRVRAPGLADTKHADAHLHRINCSYTRSVLEYLILGKLDFLDGFVATNTCDHHLRLVSEVADKSEYAFFHYFQMPHTTTAGAKQWFIQEMKRLIEHLEEHFHRSVSHDDLRHSISVYNRTRQLMARLNDMRKAQSPPLTGAEYMQIALAGMTVPREMFNEKLEALLPHLESRRNSENPLPRLMMIGGACDSPAFIDFIESRGARVVADGFCFGLRHYMNMIDEGLSDPLEAIADRYMSRIPCPSVIDGFDRTYAVIKKIIEDFDIQGVISARLKFCDHFAGLRKLLADRLRRDGGVPVIELEREYNTIKSGQISTRVQAFLEML
ncbi:MAG: 2-hydroxyacyl-CoA dehydratase family protein [Desulfobacterales bacterium]